MHPYAQMHRKTTKQWTPTREGYLRFLAESQAVYAAFEGVIAASDRPEYAPFKATGLERGAALAKDIAWFKQRYGLDAPEVSGKVVGGLAERQRADGMAGGRARAKGVAEQLPVTAAAKKKTPALTNNANANDNLVTTSRRQQQR